MRQIVDGVFEIDAGFVHAHLVVTDTGVVLVDTGLPGRSVVLARALVDARRRVGEVSAILLTHRHPEVAVFGHGRGVVGRAVDGFRRLASS